MGTLSEIDAITIINDTLSQIEDLYTRKRIIKWASDKFSSEINTVKRQSFSVQSRELPINSHTLKVEKQNSIALVDGFMKHSKRYYSSIFTAHKRAKSLENKFKEIPKLLSNFKGAPKRKYPLSQIGNGLNVNGYELSGKYIAILDRIFHINNDISIWQNLCTNGIFDIWEPEAPFNSLDKKEDPMILLLRIFEIDYDFTDEIKRGTYFDDIPSRKVRVVRPIIPKDKEDFFCNKYNGTYYFDKIISEIKFATKDFLIKEELIHDTSNIYKNPSNCSKRT